MISRSLRSKKEINRKYSSPNRTIALNVNVAAYQRLSRTVKLCQRRSIRFNDIPHSSNGVDELDRKTFVYFRSKSMNEDIDNIGLRIEMKIPNMLQNHSLGHRPGNVTEQEFKQRKFARM